MEQHFDLLKTLASQMDKSLLEYDTKEDDPASEKEEAKPFCAFASSTSPPNEENFGEKENVDQCSKLAISQLDASALEVGKISTTNCVVSQQDVRTESYKRQLLQSGKPLAVWGVVAKAVVLRTKQNKPYTKWELTSLAVGSENCTTACFLFDHSHDAAKNTPVATLVYLLNPTIDSVKNVVRITAGNDSRVVCVGRARHFGTCMATTATSGKKCPMIVNQRFGGYCEYHVSSAHRKSAGTRLELQSSYGKPMVKMSKGNYSHEIMPFNQHSAPARGQHRGSSVERLEDYGNPTKSLKDYIKVASPGSNNLLKQRTSAEKEKVLEKQRRQKVSEFLNSSFPVSMKRTWSQGVIRQVLKNSVNTRNCIVAPSGATRASLNKLRAIDIVQQTGGISKPDPNCVQKPPQLSSAKSPPKTFNGCVLTAGEREQLRDAKSQLADFNEQKEKQALEEYFDRGIAKEMMENKMRSIMELDVTLTCCKTCNYKTERPLKQCTERGHALVKIKAKKRFYRCKKCSEHVQVYGPVPTAPCRNCGQMNFEKTCMFKDSSAASPGGEALHITYTF